MAAFYTTDPTNVIGGAGRVMYQLSFDTNTFPTTIEDIINTTTYAAITAGGWRDLGFTSGGVTITRGVDTTVWDTDQETEVEELIDRWTHTIATQIVEQSLDKLLIAWEGGAKAGTVYTQHVPFGTPDSLTMRRLAILFLDKNSKIWAWTFRRTRITTMGDQVWNRAQMLVTPVTWKAFPDTAVADDNDRVFRVYTNAIT